MSSTRARDLAVRGVAIAMIVVEVVIHADLTPIALRAVPYVGVLFIVAIVLLSGAAVSLLWRRSRVIGWSLGAAVCAGMLLAFILSRTVGLPGYHETWTSDSGLGIVSLPPELIVIAAAMTAVRLRRGVAASPWALRLEDREEPPLTTARGNFVRVRRQGLEPRTR